MQSNTLERNKKMASVNGISGSGQVEAPESSGANPIEEIASEGPEIEKFGGIDPETSPNDYADGSAGGEQTTGFEAMGSSDAQSAQKEVNENTSKVLSQMGKIYIGQETSPEPMGEATGKSESKAS
jgi:hypothetical protein